MVGQGGSMTHPVLVFVSGLETYQVQLLQALHNALFPWGLPVIASSEDPTAGSRNLSLLTRLLRCHPLSGIVLTNTSEDEGQRRLMKVITPLELPVVVMGMRDPRYPCVRGDSRTGMRQLMAHLLDERGTRRPVLVRGILRHEDSRVREHVFAEELARRGLAVDPGLVVDGGFNAERTYRSLRGLLQRRRDFDAVVALNDTSACGALSALTDSGLRVPEDVALTGFDNHPASVTWPGLTTVDQHLQEQGRQAGRLLLEQIRGTPSPPGTDLVVPSQLVVRGSTAPQGSPVTTDLDEAVAMARAAKIHIGAQDAALAMAQSLVRCRTVHDVVTVLAERLHRLGVRRCFLVLHEAPFPRPDRVPDAGPLAALEASCETLPSPGRGSPAPSRPAAERPPVHERGAVSPTGQDGPCTPNGESPDLGRLIMDYRDGIVRRPAERSFPVHQLLPTPLREQLGHSLFVLQPLQVVDRDIGYVLFNQAPRVLGVSEVLRIDLGHSLHAVLSAQELRGHAENMERLVAQRTEELRRINSELQRSLLVDGLTRIANRAAFERHLESNWQRLCARPARRGATATGPGRLALLMVDVDRFKAYNDHYGHVLGDRALRTVASCLRQAADGPNDLACRYGGEEFAVVLPDRDVAAAITVAARFRTLLAHTAIPHDASGISSVVTVSIGIAVARPERTVLPHSVVQAADRALYRAKALGRDRLEVEGWQGDRAPA